MGRRSGVRMGHNRENYLYTCVDRGKNPKEPLNQKKSISYESS
jgi:hypothetical protein